MQISYRYFDGRYNVVRTAEVRLRAKLNGHEVYIDNDGWYYVECRGTWNYFSSLREANRFIRDTFWG